MGRCEFSDSQIGGKVTKHHILVVEDDDSLRGVVQEILELEDYVTHPAKNGQEALEMLDWLRADLIVSDIMMPIMNGYEFYRQIRSRPDWLHVPFIFLTAKGSRQDVLVGKQLGADDYLTKPFSADELLVAVSSKLAIAQRWRQVHQREITVIKRNILHSLSHEFRTPLTYISAYTEMLAESGGQLSQEDFQEFCQAILAGSERLRSLVEDFLFLIELETGEARLAYETRRTVISDLSPILHMVIARYEEQAQKKGLTLRVHLADGLPPVLADGEYLADTFGRLVENAIKFSPQGAGPIGVDVDTAGDMLRVAISDHGVGIPPESVDTVFQALHQVDRDRMEQQGTGSGLAIARAVLALHGGEIKVESKPGVGTTFTVLLPAGNGRLSL